MNTHHREPTFTRNREALKSESQIRSACAIASCSSYAFAATCGKQLSIPNIHQSTIGHTAPSFGGSTRFWCSGYLLQRGILDVLFR